MTAICPACGYDLETPSPVTRGDLQILIDGTAIWKGRHVRLSPTERGLVHALARERLLRPAVLADRLGCADSAVHMAAHKVNRKFREAGADTLVQSTQFYHLSGVFA